MVEAAKQITDPGAWGQAAISPVTLHLVPHTHWDREWYETFEQYRYRLVAVMDELLVVMDQDPDFRHFHLDGQTALIEDYLAVRPEKEPHIARLVADGRLSAGPWRIALDEFLCSPETILRNLQQGHAFADGIMGRRMSVGYLPDAFGHISQMPQILRLAGIDAACVWRGVPSAIDRTVFVWEAPDGSQIRTAYLASDYANARALPERTDELVDRAGRIVDALAPFRPGRVVLGMNGDDHSASQSNLPALVERANASQETSVFRIGSLEEYLAAVQVEGNVPTWRGEMRSGARAFLLMGVASARVNLKQAEWRATSELERYAEPLVAISGIDPGRLLDEAWRGLVENSAHDSISGCGVDEVAAEVAARYARTERIARLVAADGLDELARRVQAGGGILVFNPSPFARSGVVPVDLPDGSDEGLVAPNGQVVPIQRLGVQAETLMGTVVTSQQLLELLPRITDLLNGGGPFAGLALRECRLREGSTTEITLVLGSEPGEVDLDRTVRRAMTAAERHADGTIRVVVLKESVTKALAWIPSVEPVGWSVLARDQALPVAPPYPVRGSERVIDNGLIRVEVAATGAVRLIHVETGATFDRLFELEDGGDAGDEYNYSPPEDDEIVVGPSGSAMVEVLERGPLRASLRVSYEMRVPRRISGSGHRRSSVKVRLPIRLELALQANEPFVRAAIRVDNRATDHRLRVRFPLPYHAERSHADGAFDVVERAPGAEGSPGEVGLGTFPCRRWVDVSDGLTGLAVIHRGVPEYELVDGSNLSVTLLRSVGWLSREGSRFRRGAAGPRIATPGAQLPGQHLLELAAYPHEGDWQRGRVQAVAETYSYVMRSTGIASTSGSGDLQLEGSAFSCEPPHVLLSAFVREHEAIVCRIWNSSSVDTEAVLRVGQPHEADRAWRTDLLGGKKASLLIVDGRVRLSLRPWEIACLQFR